MDSYPDTLMETHSASTTSASSETGTSIQHEDVDGNNEWTCGKCSRNFSEDVKRKSGVQWIQCSFSLVPRHIKCQDDFSYAGGVYMCNNFEATEEDAENECKIVAV